MSRTPVDPVDYLNRLTDLAAGAELQLRTSAATLWRAEAALLAAEQTLDRAEAARRLPAAPPGPEPRPPAA